MLKAKYPKSRIVKAATAVAVCTILGVSCAKISEPQPPYINIPKPASDLAVHQLSDTIVLTVSKPLLNTDGSAASPPVSVEVFRLSEKASQAGNTRPLTEQEFGKQASHILSIPSSSFSSYLQGDSFVIQDKLELEDKASIYSHTFRYAVLFLNKKREAAGFSNQALLAPVAIPLPPSGLSAKMTEASIKLQWTEPSENMDGSTPPRFAGYNVYRAEEPRIIPSVPVNPDPLQQAEFENRNFEFDRTYYYSVRTVGSLKDPYAISLPSEILSVESRDVFPPAPPESFNAMAEGGAVVLLWTPSSSTDVAGYRIYRQDQKTAARTQLQKDLITALSYRDNPAESGSFEYAICSVDAHGNESAPVRTEVIAQ